VDLVQRVEGISESGSFVPGFSWFWFRNFYSLKAIWLYLRVKRLCLISKRPKIVLPYHDSPAAIVGEVILNFVLKDEVRYAVNSFDQLDHLLFGFPHLCPFLLVLNNRFSCFNQVFIDLI
jgi:hypothetical protein